MGPERTSKFVGAILGSALGDAVGQLAFTHPSRDSLRRNIDRSELLRYTDDTAMTIGLAESIIQQGTIAEQHLGDTFARNFEWEPWRGYAAGPPTIFAMVRRERISYSEAASRIFDGTGSFGNGAAMRIAPVGLFFSPSEDIYDRACQSARITHCHPVGMDGAAVQALAVAQAASLDPEKEFDGEDFIGSLVGSSRTAEIREKMEKVRKLIGGGIPPNRAALEIGRSVAVQESMPFAVYAFLRHPSSYKECMYCAVLNGGDRDTLGAMAGAISGAYLGVEAIPGKWVQKLENGDSLTGMALRLEQAYRSRRRG